MTRPEGRALRMVVVTAGVIGLVGVVFLVTGSPGAFFGSVVVGGGLAGLGWAGGRLMAPPEEAPNAASTVAGVVFGGAGAVMLIGAVALLVQGEFGGAAGLAVFGTVFCGVGWAGYRVFRAPEGRRPVLVAERAEELPGAARRTTRTYRYLDAKVPDAQVDAMQRGWADRPWTQRPDWSEGKVVQEGSGSMRLLVGFTAAWNVIAWGIAGLALLGGPGGGDAPWFVLVFPLVGLGLVVATARTWIRRRRFGIGVLHLETVPGRLGRRLRGRVETGVAPADAPGDGFRVRLHCVERRSFRDRDGDDRVTEDELWGDEWRERGRVEGASGLVVAIDIPLPDHLPPTEMLPEDDRVLWRLAVTASLPGVDYAALFEVPVFPPEEEGG